MKKVLSFLLILLLSFSLTGCALVEYFQNKQYEVHLGDGKNTVKWHLVSSDNAYRAVESAHFEFDKKTFKYYENGVLKKEGDYSATYFGLENSNTPLHLNLNFGKNENGLSIFDYIDCYTEDDKNALGQFTVVSEGYHIEPLRSGGVPVRDYHLSDMPYAFGTYVREGAEQYTYQNGKVNYLGSAKLDGTFRDANGNVLYLVNNSYSANYQSTDYSKYTVYMRYENNTENTVVEGTIKLSCSDGSSAGKCDVALIHVMHGENEPAAEAGTYAEPDYQLIGFSFGDDGSITFSSGDYFYGNCECNFDPAHFIGGTYYKN